ncbi:MAG: alpha-amylase family glycosyl hydrolase [Gemmatimonadales bacterium]|nr:alpha-amylase family glycosyl hydrolase [Gemmatimonadales bacterium]
MRLTRAAALAAGLLAGGACTPAPRAGPAAATPATADSAWVRSAALYEVFVQDFSPEGTLRGVLAGLDRISTSGADVIWLMPLQPVGVERRKGPLGSRYSIRDYRAIDPALGSAADLRALVDSAHARGLKVILDWVPDHTAWDHPWITERPDYYVKDARGAISVPIAPDGKPTDWTDVAQLDFANPAVRREMVDAMRFWLETYGLDGFRVDVAGFVPIAFWREAIPALRAAVPRRLLLLAEWGDLALHDAGFDLTYGWDGYAKLKEVWKGAPASVFVEQVMADAAAMPAGGGRLRFTTNHDETAWDRPPVTLFGGAAGARTAFVAMALLPGRPLLYNGQEVESPQRLGLFERTAVAWGQPDSAAARAHYARVMDLARTEPALRAPAIEDVATDAEQDVIAYRRGDLLVLVNARPRPVSVTPQGIALAGATDLLGGPPPVGTSVALASHGAVVLRLARP